MRKVGIGAEKPGKKNADAKDKSEIKRLKAENEELKTAVAELKAENEELRAGEKE